MIFRPLTFATLFLLSANAAYAAQGKALLDELVAALSNAHGTEISWASIAEHGNDSFALADVVIKTRKGNKTSIDTVVVHGLNETNGRLSYATVAIGNFVGPTSGDGQISVAGIASTNGDWPFGIWQNGLTAEEKRERIRFGNFTINGIESSDKGTNITLDSIAMTNADIPLDFRFNPETAFNTDNEPAAPAKFDMFTITGLSVSREASNFKMTSLTIADANIPTTINASIADWMNLYSAFSINGISTTMAGISMFALDNISATITPPDAGGTVSSSAQMSGLTVNLKSIPDPEAQRVITALDYEKVEGSMSGIGTYNLNTGRISVDDIIFKFKDMIDLSLKYAITGYTTEVAQKFTQAQMEIIAGKEPLEAYGAILEDLGGLKFENFEFGLTDHSLTGRLLDFQAEQMGTTGDQLAAGAPMMIGLGMGGLQMPALTAMVTAAVGKFLKDKGTIEVVATPAQPLPILDLVLAGQTNPKSIPEMLNLQVTAE